MSFETAEMGTPATDKVAGMLRAIERGDMETFRACFAPGALVWHNVDGVAKGLDDVCAMVGGLLDASTSVIYETQSFARKGHESFIQHVLRANLKSGEAIESPAILRVETNDDGLVTRIDEYYDSRATDCLG